MITKIVLIVALSQYVRSRVDDGNETSLCLYWSENSEIVFNPNGKGNPDTPGDTEFSAISASIQTWQREHMRCGSLNFSEGPRTSARKVGYNNGASAQNENVVLFRQRFCKDVVPINDVCLSQGNCGNSHDCWPYTLSAIAITTTTFNKNSGKIYDADIELNAARFMFTTVDSPICVGTAHTYDCVATDIQNTVTHEIGHLLGLAHINLSGSTMAPKATAGETSKRILDPGSKQFICDVYPPDKPSRSCIIKPIKTTFQKSHQPINGCTAAPDSLALSLALWTLMRWRRGRRGRHLQ